MDNIYKDSHLEEFYHMIEVHINPFKLALFPITVEQKIKQLKSEYWGELNFVMDNASLTADQEVWLQQIHYTLLETSLLHGADNIKLFEKQLKLLKFL